MNVEVERKFVCDAEIMGKLQDIGARRIGLVQFGDQYFDSPDLLLTLQDFWLRRREGLWELKCPTVSVSPAGNAAQNLCSRYREINSLPMIQSEVRRVLSQCSAEGSRSHSSPMKQTENKITGMSLEDAEWLNEFGLTCFAEFRTERCSYLLEKEDGPVRVDLDQADFGYCVGEMEILVPEGGDVNAALQRITSTAEQLGLSSEERVKGKMDVYLERFHPEHYIKLLHAHVL
ncbi:hypothetical protein DNTS_008484 [Danionella cerebrum]|uniref:Thiamine-triphosphatase n=1 Tax=Danionella cerebrum TaxID=2873325 RepID=A0A553MRG4_9TELE|nr:hypothetical protein DNTS_008484 [Danionella translucida]